MAFVVLVDGDAADESLDDLTLGRIVLPSVDVRKVSVETGEQVGRAGDVTFHLFRQCCACVDSAELSLRLDFGLLLSDLVELLFGLVNGDDVPWVQVDDALSLRVLGRQAGCHPCPFNGEWVLWLIRTRSCRWASASAFSRNARQVTPHVPLGVRRRDRFGTAPRCSLGSLVVGGAAVALLTRAVTVSVAKIPAERLTTETTAHQPSQQVQRVGIAVGGQAILQQLSASLLSQIRRDDRWHGVLNRTKARLNGEHAAID